MSAARYNEGKPMLSFVLQFPTACEAMARVKEIGAIKYERDNWRKGGKPDYEYLDACLRHIVSYMEGEMFAKDTGCTHLGHAMWNIMALQELNNKGVTHDPDLFAKMCEYWKVVRECKERGDEPPTIEEFTSECKTFQSLEVPGVQTFFFEEPIAVFSGQTLCVNMAEKVAQVYNEDGAIIDEVALVDSLPGAVDTVVADPKVGLK